MIKIAILYICTGMYNKFFSGFFDSSERFFLPGKAEIEYFVFTDNMSLSNHPRVHLFERKCKGFPMDSLFRFEMFLSVSEYLKNFDYCFFFNSNMMFVDYVGSEILPIKDDLMAVIHPGYYKTPACLLPYENNNKSTAFIHRIKGKKFSYYMGSLNGGKTEAFLELSQKCLENTKIDCDNDIIALVHDESHLNKYLSEHECLSLSPAYAYPEGWNIPFKPKIIIRDKVKIDNYFSKGRDFSIKGKIKIMLTKIIRIIKWYLTKN